MGYSVVLYSPAITTMIQSSSLLKATLVNLPLSPPFLVFLVEVGKGLTVPGDLTRGYLGLSELGRSANPA